MRHHVIDVETAYRAGRFAIAGQRTASARSLLLSLDAAGEGRSVSGLGEAVPSRRVLGVDEAAVRRLLDTHGARLKRLVVDPDGEPPAVGGGPMPGPVGCALDGAILDAWARAREEPVWRALGLPRAPVTTSATVSVGTPEEMAAEAGALLAAGFGCLKVKLGEGPDVDRQRIEAVRDKAGRATLRVDANEGWDVKATLAMVRALADADVELVEQPLHRDAAAEDHHAVNRALEEHDIPHVLDETVHTANDARRIAQARLAHGVNLKLQKAGGLRPGLELVKAARDGGLRVMVGCFLETWAGISLALQSAAAVDWVDLDGAWLLAGEPVEPEAPFLADGVLEATRRPGLGVRLAPGLQGGGPGGVPGTGPRAKT